MQLSIHRFFNRATWLKVHVYLALTAGFFFALMALTGSLSVYREELDSLFNPKLTVEQPAGKRQSLDTILAAVQKAHPDRYGSWTLEMPRSPDGMITAWFDKPRETFFELHAPLMVSVNPYTAEVVANRFWGQTFTTWLLDLHTQLGMDQSGWNAVGVLGFMLMVSIVSGVYLWWPGWNGIFAALTVRHTLGLMRLAFDLHKLVGLCSAAILLLLAVTGINLSFPGILESLVGASGMAHGETGKAIISTARPNKHPTLLESAEFVARAPFPRAELRRVTTPTGDSGVYRINLRQGSEINQRHPYTTVWVDRWSGQMKEIRDPSKFSIGETLMTWLWPVHTGEAFGALGRFLWFLSGISLFALYVTGVVHWLYRHGKVKDRNVNLEALRPWLVRAQVMVRRWALYLLKKAKEYLPLLLKICADGWQRLRLIITEQQKRLEK